MSDREQEIEVKTDGYHAVRFRKSPTKAWHYLDEATGNWMIVDSELAELALSKASTLGEQVEGLQDDVREARFSGARERNKLAGAIIDLMEKHGLSGEQADWEFLDAIDRQELLSAKCTELRSKLILTEEEKDEAVNEWHKWQARCASMEKEQREIQEAINTFGSFPAIECIKTILSRSIIVGIEEPK